MMMPFSFIDPKYYCETKYIFCNVFFLAVSHIKTDDKVAKATDEIFFLKNLFMRWYYFRLVEPQIFDFLPIVEIVG